jgi:multicomponent Na+:H+ antiporter subunit D
MKLQKSVFFNSLSDEHKNIKEVPLLMRLPMVILAIVCIFGGLLALPAISKVFLQPAQKVLLENSQYKESVLNSINEK